MGWKGTLKSVQAAVRAAERDSRRRQRDLERRRQAIERANELDRAAYEVEVYQNRIAQLVSVHKEASGRIDWQRLSRKSPPESPKRSTMREDAARHRLATYKPGLLTRLLKRVEQERLKLEQAVEAGRNEDEIAYGNACRSYDEQCADWKEQKEFAERMLRGDSSAYIEAIKEIQPFSELSDLGSGVSFEILSPQLVKTDVFVHGEAAIPRESKGLLKSGKLSIKQVPKGEFYRLYQDYVGSCVLRVARELFAILPVETVVVSALDDLVNSSTGHLEKQPILSVLIPRQTLDSLRFDLIDPSDSMKNFVHRMDFKATSGFRPVERVSADGARTSG